MACLGTVYSWGQLLLTAVCAQAKASCPFYFNKSFWVDWRKGDVQVTFHDSKLSPRKKQGTVPLRGHNSWRSVLLKHLSHTLLFPTRLGNSLRTGTVPFLTVLISPHTSANCILSNWHPPPHLPSPVASSLIDLESSHRLSRGCNWDPLVLSYHHPL